MGLFNLRRNRLENRVVGGGFPVPPNKILKIARRNWGQTRCEIRIETSEWPIEKYVPCRVSQQLT